MNKVAMKRSPIPAVVLSLLWPFVPACNSHQAVHEEEAQKIVVGTLKSKPITLDREFVCQIHSRRRVEIRALQRWYLQTVQIQAGQQVKAGEVMLKVGQNNAPLATDSDVTEVKAPFDGIIDRLPEQQGSFVEMGTPLITLSDNNVMRGDFEVPNDLYVGYMADANDVSISKSNCG